MNCHPRNHRNDGPVPLGTLKPSRVAAGVARVGMWFAVAVVVLVRPSDSLACFREQADRRAIQWSDAIVHAQLIATAVDHAGGASDGGGGGNRAVYDFRVIDSVDGPLVPNAAVRVLQVTPPGLTADPCGQRLTSDDVGKRFLILLLRRPSMGDGVPYVLVTVAAADTDPSAIAAFAQLVADTRKDERSLMPDQARAQAQTLAGAQDDTEAEQAEQALRDMGPKAVPGIRQVLDAAVTSNQGKAQLAKLIKELLPPAIEGVTTQPSASTQP
jgi:hypothetical protein